MRIIKFRAWDRVTKRMFYFDLFDLLKKNERNINFPITQSMQFTGLTDKNSKEIYEGDIVKITGAFTLGEPAIKEITHDDNGGFLPFSEMWASGRQVVPMYNKKNCEVIGNIYQNRELLK